MKMQPFFYARSICNATCLSARPLPCRLQHATVFHAIFLHFSVIIGAPPSHFSIKIMRYWLMKSEPGEVSIDDALAAPNQTVAWTGVRNYQARNFMRDAMQVGDGVLFYHSSCAEPGIAGLADVASTPYPDETQFDPGSHYFDPKATRETPRWMLVDVRIRDKTRLIPLSELRQTPELAEMVVLQKGSRLSITPVAADEWKFICEQLL
jgi:predicted RNA-binding protein with PUA-like domain